MQCSLPITALVLVLLAGHDPEEVGDTTREILRDGYQTELPGDEWLRARDRGTHSRPPDTTDRWEYHEDVPVEQQDTSEALTWFVYAIAVVFVGLVALGLILDLRRRRRLTGVTAIAGDAPGPDLGTPDDPRAGVANWEDLAREGHYSEAVHLLLLAAISELPESGKESADTSRELLERVRLPVPAREALRDLVLTVERSLFGGRDLQRTDFERSRDGYSTLRAQLGKGTPDG